MYLSFKYYVCVIMIKPKNISHKRQYPIKQIFLFLSFGSRDVTRLSDLSSEIIHFFPDSIGFVIMDNLGLRKLYINLVY